MKESADANEGECESEGERMTGLLSCSRTDGRST